MHSNKNFDYKINIKIYIGGFLRLFLQLADILIFKCN
jgi:hypothetical protein